MARAIAMRRALAGSTLILVVPIVEFRAMAERHGVSIYAFGLAWSIVTAVALFTFRRSLWNRLYYRGLPRDDGKLRRLEEEVRRLETAGDNGGEEDA
ncbi:MAG: hypothetical protein ACYC96_15920 [Fimbriimonadaceae bacterium]